MKYKYYTEEDFIKDEYFQKWILDPDPMVRSFWENWLDKHPGKRDIIEFAANMIRLLNFDGDNMSHSDFNGMWEHIILKRKDKNFTDYKKDSKVFNPRKTELKIAAVFVGLIGLLSVIIFWNNYDNAERTTGETGTQITLTLDDGTILELDELSSETIYDNSGQNTITHEEKILSYPQGFDSLSKTVFYNELTVPYGKRFEIILSDNSHVFLNSGSTIRYPVRFPENGGREVFLAGEAYFSVSHDETRAFMVITDDMNTRVYGTEFNVSSYKNENNTSTVLIKGSVGIYKSDHEDGETPLMITPGQRAVFQEDRIDISSVDVSKYVAWKGGNLLFIDDSFELILKKLERQFNLDIENKFKELGEKKFTGSFTDEPIEEILKIFSSHTHFKFEITNNKVVISD
jgi:ferric-dicitrate binding protein FerR (iron transport regulator)